MSQQAAQNIKAEKTAQNENESKDFQPYIPASRSLPEITVKAIILSVLLSIIMTGSNAYLALKVGLTVSATIPAAIMSMAILRLFKNANILENNIVQTAASVGEAIAAAVAFTLPALIMMGYWQGFPFWLTSAIVVIGGLLGVLFSIPLRTALVVKGNLKFPEGIATGEVLKIGDGISSGARDLVFGGVGAALFKFGQSGLMVLGESVRYWTPAFGSVFGFGTGLSLVLVGAGYIVGIQVGVSMVIGGVLAWCVGVPLYGYLYGVPEGMGTFEAAATIWNGNIRMIGVGMMVIGGLYTVVHLFKPMKDAITSSFAAVKKVSHGVASGTLRTERDIPIKFVFMGIALLTIPLVMVFAYVLETNAAGMSASYFWFTIAVMTVFSLIAGFICSAIGGYMAGLIGSSNNPISGITIMAVLLVSVILLVMLGSHIIAETSALTAVAGAALAIIIGGVIANAASVSCDNLQDLKAGRIVGATPWKQQVMLMIGVVVGGIILPPILSVMFEAYGIGNIFPREGMDPTQVLAAPKAALMAAIAESVLSKSLDWNMFALGGALAVAVLLIDAALKKGETGWRVPILAVALGIYMPLEITVPTLIGGIIWYVSEKRLDRKREVLGLNYEVGATHARRRGLLFSSGMIAGEAITGILLAIPFAAYQSTQIFNIAPAGFGSTGMILGVILFSGMCYYLFRAASRPKLG